MTRRWVEWVTRLEDRFLDRLRSRRAYDVSTAPPTGTLASFAGHHCCVLVSYRRDGRAVPSPLWFGIRDGCVYVHTGGAKLHRIRRNPSVLVAPSTFRGRPTAPPLAAEAAVVGEEDAGHAEAAIAANFGLGRRLYYGTIGRRQHELGAYVRIVPVRPDA